MVTETDQIGCERRCFRRLLACLAVLTWYLWLIVSLAVGAAGIHFFGWHFAGFRIDAVYHILFVHLCGALAATTAWRIAHGAGWAPRWSDKAALAVLLFTLAPLPLETLSILPLQTSSPKSNIKLALEDQYCTS